MRRVWVVAVAVVLGGACGTGSTDLDVAEPTATLFDDEEVDDTETVESTTTVSVGIGLDDLDPADLPAPLPDAPGVVLLDGIAAPLIRSGPDGWVAETPCGFDIGGSTPDPSTAIVALDPAGDAGDPDGAEELRRNSTIAEAIRDRLEAAGIPAIVTRAAGTDVAASYRARSAAAAGARIVVSVALVDGVESAGDEPALEVVHPAADAEARRLAGLVFAELEPVIGRLAVEWPADLEPGVRAVLNQRGDDYFTILRSPAASSRVVLHLPVDAATAEVFANGENAAPIADAVATAIAQHLVSEREGAGFVTPAEVVRDAPVVGSAPECVDPVADDG